MNATDAKIFELRKVSQSVGLKCGSLCSYSRGFCAAGNDGTVIVVGEDKESIDWQATRVAKNVSRTAIKQSCIGSVTSSKRPDADPTDMLFLLTHEGVTLMSVPDLKLKGQAYRTNNASAFAWNAERSLLVVSMRRKLVLFSYQACDLTQIQETTMADVVLKVAWASDMLCCCTKSSLFAVEFAPGKPREVMTWRKGEVTSVTTINSSQVLLQRDADLYYINSDGKASESPWTLPGVPSALTHTPNYLLVTYPEEIMVYPISEASNHPILQTISLSDITDFSGSCLPATNKSAPGPVFIVTPFHESDALIAHIPGGSVHKLQAAPHEEQVQRIADMGLLPDAIAVSRTGDQAACSQLQDDLHIRWGVLLCNQGDFDEGMLQIASAQRLEPLALLQFFPDLLPRSLAALVPLHPHFQKYIPPPPTPPPTVPLLTLVLPYLHSYRSRLLALHQPIYPGSTIGDLTPCPSLTPLTPRTPDGTESVTLLQDPRTPGTPSTDHLAKPSSRMSSFLDDDQSLLGTAASYEQPANPVTNSKLRTIIDTALLIGWISVGDSQATLRLLRSKNFVALVEGRNALTDAGLYLELVELYEQRSQHTEALDTLHTLSCSPRSLIPEPQGGSRDLRGEPGVWRALKYLRDMPQTPVASSLACMHAERWLLEADAPGIIEVLLHRSPAVSPKAVLHAIHAKSPRDATSYLEQAISMGIAAPEEFSQELAFMYIQDLVNASDGGSVRALWNQNPTTGDTDTTDSSPPTEPTESTEPTKGGSGTRQALQDAAASKLLSMLQTSPYLDIAQLQRKLPQKASGKATMHVRALLHERLQQHEDALDIYVDKLNDFRLAEAYADRLYSALEAASDETWALSACISMGPRPASQLSSLHNNMYMQPLDIESVKQPQDVYGWLLKAFVKHASTTSTEKDETADRKDEKRRTKRSVTQKYLNALPAALRGAPPPNEKPSAEAAAGVWAQPLKLVGKKWERMDVAASLCTLPSTLRARDLAPSLSSILQGMQKRSNDYTIQIGLHTAGKLELTQKRIHLQQRHVQLSAAAVCCGCQRRMGYQQCVLTPAGNLWHESCFIDSSTHATM